MNLLARLFNWLGPKPMTAADCGHADDPPAWKELEAAVAANTPKLGQTTRVRLPENFEIIQTADLVTAPPTFAEREAANLVGISATKRTLLAVSKPKPAKSRKKRRTAPNVSRETFPKKRRKRSK